VTRTRPSAATDDAKTEQRGPEGLLDVAGAAAYLGVTEAFIRRLVLERRIRYFKLGKFVRFKPADLDAFVSAGRRDPVQPWVPVRSTRQRVGTSGSAQVGGRGRDTGLRRDQPLRKQTRRPAR